jgi:hypothetical protein
MEDETRDGTGPSEREREREKKSLEGGVAVRDTTK